MSVVLAVQGHRYGWRGLEVLAQESGALVLAKVIDKGRLWPLDAPVLVDAAELVPLGASAWSEARLGQRAVTFWHPSRAWLEAFVGVEGLGLERGPAYCFRAALGEIAAAELPQAFPVFIGDAYFRAVWLCHDPRFWGWINSTTHGGVFWHVHSAKDAGDFVREICGVQSLRMLDFDVSANQAWCELVRWPYSEYVRKS